MATNKVIKPPRIKRLVARTSVRISDISARKAALSAAVVGAEGGDGRVQVVTGGESPVPFVILVYGDELGLRPLLRLRADALRLGFGFGAVAVGVGLRVAHRLSDALVEGLRYLDGLFVFHAAFAEMVQELNCGGAHWDGGGFCGFGGGGGSRGIVS